MSETVPMPIVSIPRIGALLIAVAALATLVFGQDASKTAAPATPKDGRGKWASL